MRSGCTGTQYGASPCAIGLAGVVALSAMRILVTGATGYIGGRLVPQLLDAGHEVRCLARDPTKLSADSWRARVDVVEGDVLDPDGLRTALEGCDAAFYLIHSMEGGVDFADRDRRAAENFRDAAAAAGVRRIVYLGGLGDESDELSRHLSSRHEVGRILASGPTPVTELRAAVIIGSGSVSFEMLRYLTEVLPVMITPRWVRTRCQPIAIRDVLLYLLAVQAAVQSVCGMTTALSTGGGTSDGRFIAPTGTELVELGPPNATIHQVDEHVRTADLEMLHALYVDILRRMLT